MGYLAEKRGTNKENTCQDPDDHRGIKYIDTDTLNILRTYSYSVPSFLNCTHYEVKDNGTNWGSSLIKPTLILLLMQYVLNLKVKASYPRLDRFALAKFVFFIRLVHLSKLELGKFTVSFGIYVGKVQLCCEHYLM